ncbi:MAG: proton-conducting transporter membrane subunit [Steroidobacteraceae bacterium]
MPDLLIAAFWFWSAGLLLALLRLDTVARWLIAIGAAAGVVGAVCALPQGGPLLALPIGLADQTVRLHYTPEALWLMGFGLLPAALAIALGSPVHSGRSGWLCGAAISLLGALGVYGVQDGYSFLIAWELMSLGGAVMILSERMGSESGRSTLFMLSLLEVGSVAIMLALLLWGHGAGGNTDFASFLAGTQSLSPGVRVWIGVLVLIGFGAKLGLLPFYEWFPNAYAAGSGVTGTILSGVVLNAAFFALARALVDWLPSDGNWLFGLGVIVIAIGVLSSILAALYAFQQDDWRRLLAFSSAENAAISVAALGACLIFRADGQSTLAGLAWTVALLHLAGHTLAKGGLFLCADGVYGVSSDYRIAQGGWLRNAGLALGIGGLFGCMSLAAMPPQIGFVTEWFTFQTVFQGFHLSTLTGRLTLGLAGAGLALTAAIALATFVKLLGIGLLGAGDQVKGPRIEDKYGLAALLLGLAVLGTAAGLPIWLSALDEAGLAHFGAHTALAMSSDWMLVPLTSTFAFISPSKLMIVMPLLAVFPLLLLLNARRHPIRRTRVWYGGLRESPRRAATTSLTFANAMRTFYSFIYRPTLDTAREHRAVAYFIRKLEFEHDVADVFGPVLFTPIRSAVWRLARWLRVLQSGDLNLYLALIGGLLILILALTLR